MKDFDGRHSGCEVRDLRFTAGGEVLVDLPKLRIAPGLTVLAGASGSGKSTLLYLLSGLSAPSRGSVLWGDADLARMSETGRDGWRRQNAGFIFQDFHLIEELSPLENVLVPALFSHGSTSRFRERAQALLDRLDVPSRRRVALLSRGEQQRVAIARALLFEPPIIFADEPTASLDAKAGAQVAGILAALAQEGRVVIAASHDPAVLELTAEVVHLDHGRRIA